ncbi:MAG TPA: carboxypeptidase-like regulatory domain-containing protein [Yinghuangia sp.]|uniref:signal protein n=1 Tax=Yinghuangia sp. YIM S10712 TaxID=3436930 RepID=UPI002B7BC12D|nr:carboxypeptidase-like regulatory domain-containing protein [Yinghuangia sp.]
MPTGLQARWLTWVASQPEESNPVSDPTGEFCARGQAGDLWLVAGTFGGTARRSCTVPAGRSIAGPVLNLWEASRADCAAFLNNAQGRVLVDGRPVEAARVDAESVSFTGVAGNTVTGRAGTARTVTCGLWFTVPPLAPGDHSLTIAGATEGFSLRVEYALTVTG